MRELQLLVTLASHPQRIMTREELFTEDWGSQPRRDDRSVDVYVSRLRAKLGKALPETQLIHTHNGIGYRFSTGWLTRLRVGGFYIFFTSSIQRR